MRPPTGRRRTAAPAVIRVGVAGWSYEDWEGIVYPAGKPSHFDRPAYLARYFDVIEINSSFYRIPEPGVAQSWARRVKDRPDFRFTLKLHQAFTHRAAGGPPGDEAAFKRALEPLARSGRLGALLIQFPYSFHPGPAARETMEALFASFRDYPRVVEIRHAGWATDGFFQFLRQQGVGFCNLDQPPVGRSLGPTAVATAQVGYVRLHGRNAKDWFRPDAGPAARYDYLYPEEELAPWVGRIRQVAEQAADVFIIANNHYRGKAPAAALTLLALLAGRPVAAPPDLAAAYPQLAPHVLPPPPPPQGRLFGD